QDAAQHHRGARFLGHRVDHRRRRLRCVSDRELARRPRGRATQQGRTVGRRREQRYLVAGQRNRGRENTPTELLVALCDGGSRQEPPGQRRRSHQCRTLPTDTTRTTHETTLSPTESSCSASSNYVIGQRGTTEMSAVDDFPDFTPASQDGCIPGLRTPQTANAAPGNRERHSSWCKGSAQALLEGLELVADTRGHLLAEELEPLGDAVDLGLPLLDVDLQGLVDVGGIDIETVEREVGGGGHVADRRGLRAGLVLDAVDDPLEHARVL